MGYIMPRLVSGLHRRAFLIAILLILMLPASPVTAHDGKTSMDRHILRDSIIMGITSAGYEATEDRIALLMETAAAESRCGMFNVPYRQRGSFGVFQIMPKSAEDTLDWLRRSDAGMWRGLMRDCYDPEETLVDNLVFNPEFSAAVAWLIYRRMGGRHADISTREKRATLWKRVYNTALGAGTEAGYIKAAKECLDGE